MSLNLLIVYTLSIIPLEGDTFQAKACMPIFERIPNSILPSQRAHCNYSKKADQLLFVWHYRFQKALLWTILDLSVLFSHLI